MRHRTPKRGERPEPGVDPLLSRRDVVWHGMAGAALICSFKDVARLTSRPSGKPGPARRRGLTSGFEPFRAELPVPKVLPPVVSGHSYERYEIEMRDGVAEILPGLQTPIRGYEGTLPGPTIKARRGRPTEVVHTNGLGEHYIVHLHGGLVDEASDGALHDFHIAPGGVYTYHYPNSQPGATLWYHDHVHGQVSEHVHGGLAGFYLLEDERERDDLGLPGGKRDVPLMIQDRSFNSDGSFRYLRDLDRGFLGDTILVNGAIAPRMEVKRRLYRLRILNASNARVYRLALGNGRKMIQIANDAGLLRKPVKRTEISISPAERVEVLVDFARYRPGTQLVLRNLEGAGSTISVMRFDVVGGRGERERMPRRLGPREAPLPPPAAERSFSLTFKPPPQAQWQINGQGFDPSRIDLRARLGTTELWHFLNSSHHAHPMHLHGCHFKVVSVNGAPPEPGDDGWMDTVSVPANGNVTVQPYFNGFAGRFVFHCHTLEHEDESMMGLMEVVT